MNGSALRQEKGLDGAALKWIAICSMLIDHIGAVVLEYGLYYEGGAKGLRGLAEGPWGNEIEIGAWFLRVLGRPAFMIYCFLLVEGFIHTRNRMKYGKNLLIFSLISEIPFDLAVGNGLFVPEYQNVFFELFIGFGVLSALERVKLRECGSGIAQTPRRCLYIGIGCAVAELLRADYGASGILIIAAFYLLSQNRKKQTAAAAVLGFLESFGITLGAGGLAAIPIGVYNGKRGKQRYKYLFYWFYPVHLLLLYAVRWYFLGIRPA